MLEGILDPCGCSLRIVSDMPNIDPFEMDNTLIHTNPDLFYGLFEVGFRAMSVLERLEYKYQSARGDVLHGIDVVFLELRAELGLDIGV